MKKKTIAYLLGAAAILCLAVGGVKLVQTPAPSEVTFMLSLTITLPKIPLVA